MKGTEKQIKWAKDIIAGAEAACNQIIRDIAMSRLTDGEVLPSVRQLAEDIGINMHTVNKAYTVLKQEGYVKVDRRKGAVISVSSDKEQALEAVRKDLSSVLAEACCRNITKEDIHRMVDQIYDTFPSR